MSTQAHTPGPWEVNVSATPRTEVFAGNFLICEVIGGQSHLGQHRDTQQDEANAHLIAAAPDMLAVLNAARIMLKNRDQRPEEMKLLDAIKAVIANAEGRS